MFRFSSLIKNIWNSDKFSASFSQLFFICMLLGFAILIIYWQVISFDFVNFDDPAYVISNNIVKQGITLEGIKWAFSSFVYVSYWHPITWISHMLDIQLFGMNSGMHHFTNVIFHILNSMLLFIVLEKMTGALWRSAVVAFLFALHPLHVESVAWISERKDVLSTFFWMLTMMGYLWYVHHPSVRRYLTVIFFYILGLMSKPMLVTLPFVLLLLDYWPLNRLDLDPSGGMGKKHELRSHGICWSRIPRLIVEKIPMIVLAVLSSSLTIIVQHKVGALKSFKIFPFSVRISNAIISYVAYLGKMVWPLNLAVFYPYPKQFSILTVVMCLLLLIAITVLVVMSVRRLPYLVTGWFWYLGTLVPVIGIVQVGIQSMADKYTYIPLIGIFVMIAWGIPELLDKWQFKKIALATLTGIVIPILIACSWMQVEYWKNDNMLYGHALNVTMNNELAHYNLACALMDQGDLDSAIKECAEALRISPNHAVAYNLMGQILKMKGDLSKAINYYSKAIQNAPTYAEAYNNLGVAFMYESRFSDAIKMFSKVLELEPGNVAADVNMGSCLKFQGRVNEAIHYLKKALQIRPDLLAAHYFLGEALFLQGKIDESIIQYKKIMQMDPDNKSADQILNKLLINKDRLEIFVASLNKDLDNNSRKIELYMKLGNMYLDGGDKLRAVENYKTILTIDPGNLLALNRLVSVYYSLGEYDKALESMKSVIKTRPESDELYYNIASIYAKQDKIDESMKWLKLSIEKGFHDWELIKRDPDLASMRNTAFINELIKNH